MTAILNDEAIPLTWWDVTPNFGDMLSPYLVQKLTSKPVKLVSIPPNKSSISFKKYPASYLCIGSIISRARDVSTVWGSGAFGTEVKKHFSRNAKYCAVRGPLTRNLLRIYGIDCPPVYGDPALLIPKVFNPSVQKKYKVGMILRWSEQAWNEVETTEDVKKIYLGTDNIEDTLTEIMSCEAIVSSSLHGIIIADAYGIPSAWLSSTTPKGLEFKFYDYFISVNKLQSPQSFDFSVKKISLDAVYSQLKFNSTPIEFDDKRLMDACPFL